MSGELAGALRERVTIERRGPARDALGGASGGWASIGWAWAAIAPEGTGAAVAGEALAAQPRWRVTLRPTGVSVGDRIGWGERRLTVLQRIDDPRAPDRLVLIAGEAR